MLDFSRFRLLTFDCYGTLIDWESGILGSLNPILAAHDRKISDAELLSLFGELEAEAEKPPFCNYRAVLETVVRGFGDRLGFTPTDQQAKALPESVKTWKPFPDTVEALRRLKLRYRLGIISNVDDDIFAASARKLQVAFDSITTAQQAQAYKPELKIFELAAEQSGTPRAETLHVGQSTYHDVLPAQSLGIATVWVNRPSPRPNIGAVRPAMGKPDLEVHSLEELASIAGV